MNTVFKILMILTILVLLLGLRAISFSNNVFKDADAVCCDNGLCENTNPGFSTRCNSTSTVMLIPTCDEITINCRKCVDYTISGCVCYGGGSDFCMEANNSYYYGTPVNCDESK
jgi:hypothetical protein